jgi:hypothetical protein
MTSQESEALLRFTEPTAVFDTKWDCFAETSGY